jgi:hypothetical protein
VAWYLLLFPLTYGIAHQLSNHRCQLSFIQWTVEKDLLN